MRTIIHIVILLFISDLVRAQDTLYKEDGTKQIVKILAVNASVIRYELSSDTDGRIHIITIEDVKKIVYENGSVSVFYKDANNNEPPVKYITSKSNKYVRPEPTVDLRVTDFGRNFISTNVLHFLVGSVSLCYEHTFKSGKFSIRSPITIGITSSFVLDSISATDYDYGAYSGNYYRYKIFSAGVDLFKFPRGQGKARYFFGPSLEYGQFNYYLFQYQATPVYYRKEKVSYGTLLFQNGFLYQPSKHFNYSINLGVGFFIAESRNYYNDFGTTLVFRGGANIGYKF